MDRPIAGVLQELDAFLMGESLVQRTFERIASQLEELRIDFALAGGLAVGVRGHLRLTVDVAILIAADGLALFKARWLGRPKPVCFPNPALLPRSETSPRVLDLRTLIELKLASGMSSPDRLQDLADVLSLVRANRLAESFADTLDDSVREKFRELWNAAQHPPREL
jgi:hypothetical protein